MSDVILPDRLVDKQPPNSIKRPSTKSFIVEVAAKLFTSKGYHGTSTQDIANAVNIRKSSLFHHFKCKEDIASACIQMNKNKLAACSNVANFIANENPLLLCHAIFSELVSVSSTLADLVKDYFDLLKNKLQSENIHAEQGIQIIQNALMQLSIYKDNTAVLSLEKNLV